jgi:hypothetical protein
MLRSLKSLERYKLSASDGEIGSVADFFFDDHRWAVRYLVAETASFFEDRKVLISPIFFRQADWAEKRFHLAMTREKIKNSPSIDSDEPVSRQHERDYYGYYGYPYYWGYAGLWGVGAYPSLLAPGSLNAILDQHSDGAADPHLRSVNAVHGYRLQASDGEIGRVEDFFVDDETWQVRYLAVNAGSRLSGKKVLIAPEWANRISWGEKQVHFDLTRQQIETSPVWNGTDLIDARYEARLHGHYGRPASEADRAPA